MENIIEVINLTKSYKQKPIYINAGFRLKKGESAAITGHNGCGKSTFLRMVCGLTSIDSGEIRRSEEICFQYIPEHFPKLELTAAEYVKHMGRIQGISGKKVKSKSRELFEAFHMEDMIDKPMKHLSKGTLQKVGVVQAFLEEPDVLLLDEPLSGQDFDSQSMFINLVKDMIRKGSSVIMSCHEKFLVDRLSDSVYEVSGKKLVPAAAMDHISTGKDILIFIPPKGAEADIAMEKRGAEFRNGICKIETSPEESNEVISRFVGKGYQLRRMYHG